MRRWLELLAAVLALIAAPAAARETGFLNRVVAIDGQPHRYVVYVPAERPAAPPPVILALHGAGERGTDGLAQTEVGLGRALRLHPERWPAIVVFPQVVPGQTWLDNRRLALAALAKSEREFRTDPRRVYALGLSMGGNGTWALAHDDPRRFAAIVVVCGFAGPLRDYPAIVPGGQPTPEAALARSIASVPAWIVHGGADPVVPVAASRDMAAALQAAGGEVRYRELPGVGHESWNDAFADPDLPAWLFAHRR